MSHESHVFVFHGKLSSCMSHSVCATGDLVVLLQGTWVELRFYQQPYAWSHGCWLKYKYQLTRSPCHSCMLAGCERDCRSTANCSVLSFGWFKDFTSIFQGPSVYPKLWDNASVWPRVWLCSAADYSPQPSPRACNNPKPHTQLSHSVEVLLQRQFWLEGILRGEPLSAFMCLCLFAWMPRKWGQTH